MVVRKGTRKCTARELRSVLTIFGKSFDIRGGSCEVLTILKMDLWVLGNVGNLMGC